MPSQLFRSYQDDTELIKSQVKKINKMLLTIHDTFHFTIEEDQQKIKLSELWRQKLQRHDSVGRQSHILLIFRFVYSEFAAELSLIFGTCGTPQVGTPLKESKQYPVYRWPEQQQNNN